MQDDWNHRLTAALARSATRRIWARSGNGDCRHSLPVEKENLLALTELTIRHKKQRAMTLPPEILCLAKLRELDMGYNQISHIPPAIGQLAALCKTSTSHKTASKSCLPQSPHCRNSNG